MLLLNELGDRLAEGSGGARVHRQRDQGENEQSLQRDERPVRVGMWEVAMCQRDARQSQERQVLERETGEQSAAISSRGFRPAHHGDSRDDRARIRSRQTRRSGRQARGRMTFPGAGSIRGRPP